MFQGWDNVFMLMGAASGSLIGLLFVVVTLTTNVDRARAMQAGAFYLTPTMVHFAVSLVACATALAPRLAPPLSAIIIAVAALLGFSNAVRTWLGIAEFHQSGDPPHWSDIWMYGGAPGLVYIALIGVAVAVWKETWFAPGALAATLMSLMLVAIRNAWDLITWIAPRRDPQPPPDAL